MKNLILSFVIFCCAPAWAGSPLIWSVVGGGAAAKLLPPKICWADNTCQSTAAAGSSTPPGGTDTAIQFNNTDAFDGDASNFAWDYTDKGLLLGGASAGVGLRIKSSGDNAHMLDFLAPTGGANGHWYLFQNTSGTLVLDNDHTAIQALSCLATGQCEFGAASPNENYTLSAVSHANGGGFSVKATATGPGNLIDFMASDNTVISSVGPAGDAAFNSLKLPDPGDTVTPTCGAPQDRKMAMTHAYVLCVCNGSAWKKVSDGTTTCTF